MKTFFVIVFLFVAFIDVIDVASTPSTVTQRTVTRPTGTQGPTGRPTTRPTGHYCHQCSFCPNPFTSSSLFVNTVYSPNGWCQKISSTNSPDGIYTRNADLTGLCYSNGCSTKLVNGLYKWVCCCNNRAYCNTAILASKSNIFILLLSSIMLLLKN